MTFDSSTCAVFATKAAVSTRTMNAFNLSP
jgi:hypothetical protein